MQTIGNKHGFTLLEVMVSLAILGIVLVSVLTLHSQTLEMATATRADHTAAQMAQEVLYAQIEAGIDETLVLSGEFEEKYPGFKWEANQETLSLEGEDESTLQFVRVDIKVENPSVSSSYALRGYYYKTE